ncbi:MAG: AAA family ATPase [Chloroflexi bacterium]|nr:AAA family ATPase [Chloroflexota bacterium]
MKQTRSTNPFRPGSGILPPLLAGRERETAIFEARVARTREGQPQHTALLGEWAIGKTTLLMHWRRLRQQAGDAVVLSMAYPQSSDEFLAGLVNAIDAELATDGPRNLEVELGLDIGVANARIRRRSRDPERELRAALRRLIEHHARDGRSVIVLLDDVDLLPMTGDVLLRLRACALELYAADLPLAFLVAASAGLFDGVRSAHEPLVRFFEPLSIGPLDPGDATRAIIGPVEETVVRFDSAVVAEIVELAGGRPYYLQKLGYFAFDAAVDGRVTRAEFAVAFERAFASVSQEIFAARWAGMSPIDRQVVAVVARSTEPRPSGAIEAEAHRLGVRPGAARLALRRLAARGHIDRVASGHRGRYAVRDRLFQRYLELQTCEP